MENEQLLTKLKERRDELKLSDNAFARTLGISQSLWAMTLRGERVPSKKLFQRAIQVFPDLAFIAIEGWLGDLKRVTR